MKVKALSCCPPMLTQQTGKALNVILLIWEIPQIIISTDTNQIWLSLPLLILLSSQYHRMQASKTQNQRIV